MGITEDEMVEWHHQLYGHEFEQASGVDAFELWYLRRFLRVPWTARKSNQSIIKEINPEYSLEGLILKLKLQYFSHLKQELILWKRLWCWERLKAKGEGDDRGWDGWIASPTQWTWIWANWELVIDREAWHAAVAKCQTRLSDWTELKWTGNH